MSVKIYDTTLRDGNQARGISLSLADKLLITEKLVDFGVDYIEGGWPNKTNPLDIEYFEKVKEMDLKNTRIAAFGMTRHPKKKCDEDPLLYQLVASEAPVLTVFGKTWDLHVTDVIRIDKDLNLQMIEETMQYLKQYADEVVFDAEHFFDGYKNNPEYAIQTIQAAARGGADCVTLCDTNGGMALNWEVEEIVKTVRESIDCEIGIHCHNDTSSAVINSLTAVKNGAVQIQGTINGYGERCGNANLTTIIPNLHYKMGEKLMCSPNLKDLRKLSLDLDEIVNLPNNIRAPYVGEAAFTHKGGAHADGVMKVSHSFEHLNPEEVGNNRQLILSDQAGGASVVNHLKTIKPDIDKKDPVVGEILTLIKNMENEGFHFETANGSFDLLAKTKLGMFEDPIKVLGYRVIEEYHESGVSISEATVKIEVDEKISHVVAEGDGPVNALDAALRMALKDFFPFMSEVSLKDYKVRVLGKEVGTDAKVRVWTTFGDKGKNWNTAGVSTNVIEASWCALLDGLKFKIMKEQ